MRLVLLHSWGGSARSWRFVTPLLAEFECVAIDLPGFGDAPPRVASPRVADYAADVLPTIVGETIIVGHSMSAKVAMALAAGYPVAHPAGLRGLVLVAPSPLSPEPMTDEGRAELLAGQGVRATAEKTADAVTRLPVDKGPIVEDYLRTSASAWCGWLEGGSREDLSELYGRIEVPSIVIAGEYDPVMSPGFFREEVVPHLAGTRFEIVEGAGHLSPLEAPVAVAELIRRFAASLGESPTPR